MSFILTMWYVNNSIEELKDDKKKCFILTMWYVNWSCKSKWCCSNKCFILTMWYVNSRIGDFLRGEDY